VIKLYLAASFTRQAELRSYAKLLRAKGFEVTSSWLTQLDDKTFATIKEARAVATRDLFDMDDADAMIAFTESEPTRGGHHVEFGYAIGMGMPVVIVGPIENVFHTMRRYTRFDTFREALLYLTSHKNDGVL
jgi:nucleoside 2-deoxyribosyltransferase